MIGSKDEGPKDKQCQMWCAPVQWALQKLRQKNCSKFEASLGYKVRLCLKKHTHTHTPFSAQCSLSGLAISLSWCTFVAPQSEHKVERGDDHWGSQAVPLASERFTVINHRCARAIRIGKLHKHLRLHASSQCEGVSIRLLQKKTQV